MKVGSTYVLLDILDTAGHEEYSAIRDQYIRTADVVIIMYSVTNIGSFTTIGQVSIMMKLNNKNNNNNNNNNYNNNKDFI